MIKWSTLILLTGLVLLKPIAQFSWEIWYAFNFDFVAEELCENKEKVELECNGKCYLAKQLEKAEAPVEKKEERSSNPFQFKQQPLNIQDFNLRAEINALIPKENKTHFKFTFPMSTAHLRSVFHPPNQIA